MKQEAKLREAVLGARNCGVRVTRGAMFDWTGAGDEKLVSCDATGAVLLLMGSPWPRAGWLKATCSFLETDSFWLWRFWMGWNRDRQLQAWVGDDSKGRWIDDDVSHMGRRLAKSLGVSW